MPEGEIFEYSVIPPVAGANETDYCENNYKCINAKEYVQKRRMEFFNNPHHVDYRYYPDVLKGVNVIEADGDENIVD